jgi:hypothetical protein
MKLLTILLLAFAGVFHPLHISVTEITYDEKEKELEIIMRIFIDDLEASVRASRNSPELNLLEPENTSTDQLLEQYVMPRFAVLLDGRQQVAKYLGHEKDGEALLCYIQIGNVKKWKTIEVQNKVIMEMYDDQSNLVHVTVRNEVRSLRLLKEKPSGKITFDIK